MAGSNFSARFIAQEVYCSYPISTIYNSSPRYLYYALLFLACATRWRGWLSDVFLGTAATYAGTAAIQAFILLGSHQNNPPPAPVTIPYIPDGANLTSAFPSLISGTTEVSVQPSTIELDIDAVLAIVVIGYLMFLPLQCWSGSFQYKRAKYVVITLWNLPHAGGNDLCIDILYWPLQQRKKKKNVNSIHVLQATVSPSEKVRNDGWQPNLWKSSWNATVWGIFNDSSSFLELESMCFYPCFNTSQTLWQATSLEAHVVKIICLNHPRKASGPMLHTLKIIFIALSQYWSPKTCCTWYPNYITMPRGFHHDMSWWLEETGGQYTTDWRRISKIQERKSRSPSAITL